MYDDDTADIMATEPLMPPGGYGTEYRSKSHAARNRARQALMITAVLLAAVAVAGAGIFLMLWAFLG